MKIKRKENQPQTSKPGPDLSALKKVKVPPVFRFDDKAPAEASQPEPGASGSAVPPEAFTMPEPGAQVGPLTESVPYEEERRAYDRRQNDASSWLGPERRSGIDRRKAKLFIRSAPKAPEKTTFARPRLADFTAAVMRFEKLRLLGWSGFLALAPLVTYYAVGFEWALAAWGLSCTLFFISLFFRLNRK